MNVSSAVHFGCIIVFYEVQLNSLQNIQYNKFTKNGEWVVIAAPIATSVNNVLLEMPGKLPLIEAYVIHSIVDFLLNWKAQELEQKASPERPSEGGLSNI